MLKMKSLDLGTRDSLSKNWTVVSFAVVMALIVLYLVQYMMPTHFKAIWSSYGYAAIAILAAMYLYHMRLGGVIELRLYVFYIFWLFITRWLNRDFLLRIELNTMYSGVMSFLIFSSIVMLNKEQRARAMTWASGIIGGYIWILSVIGVFIAFTGVTLRIPPEMKYIGIYQGKEFNTITYFASHRNESTVWFYVGLMIMLYQFFNCKHKAWRVPIVIGAIPEYIMISITHSRTGQVVTAFSIALAIFVLLIHYLKINNKILLATILVVSVPTLTYLGYEAMGLTAEEVDTLSESSTPAFTQWYNNLDTKVSELYLTPYGTYDEGEATGGGLTDTRDFGSDAKTLTGRTKIWKAIFPVAKSRPMIMLKGTLSNCLMEEPVKYVENFTPIDMHNYLMQILMLTGIPGFLLILAFSAFLVIRLLKLMFGKDPQIKLSLKMLTIPVFGLLVDYMMEAQLFTVVNMLTNSFFVFAGMALGAYYDLFPETKLKLKETNLD